MIAKSLCLLAMTLPALVVASYSVVLLLAPELRPPLVRTLFAEHPVAAMAHLAGSALTLPIGALQLSARFRARFIRGHRWLGRLYVVGVAIGGLAGLLLALHSTGGPAAQMGFGLLAVCWLGSTFNAYRHIRVGNLRAHQRWMTLSFALTFAAVTLRLYVPISQIAGIPFAMAYPAISWLAWVPNLVLALLLTRHKREALPEAKSDPLRGAT